MSLPRLSVILLFFSCLPVAYAQSTTRELFLTLPDRLHVDTPYTELLMSFDTLGNFCMYKSPLRGEPVITNKGTYGPFQHQADFNPTIFYNIKGKDQYIKCRNSPLMYGPVDGDISHVPIISAPDGVAYTVVAGDSVRYFVNDNHVATTGCEPGNRLWCTFSGNGHVLYTICRGRRNYLYLNYRLVDSSVYIYGGLAVDDENSYRYSLGSARNSSYTPRPHDAQKVFGPVAAHSSVFAGYADTLYYYGNGNGAAYRIESDSLYRDMPERQKIVAPGGGNNFLRYTPVPGYGGFARTPAPKETTINVNGKILTMPYSEIYYPAIDGHGNYALFGLRDYYLYANINGVEQPQPLSRHGVRATPLSIDAQGNTICCYKTDDSVFVYQNDYLVNKCAAAQFNTLRAEQLIMQPWLEKMIDLSALSVDTSCYILYKNRLSSPILPPTVHTQLGYFQDRQHYLWRR